MGYLHIDNLYKNQDILLFKECYALEKIHGTSAHVALARTPNVCDTPGQEQVFFNSGGAKHETFVALFNEEDLKARFAATGAFDVRVHGEAYGGKQQGQKWRYGDALKFVAFDVKIGEDRKSVV